MSNINKALQEMKSAYSNNNHCIKLSKYIESKNLELDERLPELKKKVERLEESKHEALGRYGIGEAKVDELEKIRRDLTQARDNLEMQDEMLSAIKAQQIKNSALSIDVKNKMSEARARYAATVGDEFESQITKKVRELIVSVYVANRFGGDNKIGSMVHVDWEVVLINCFPKPDDNEISPVVDKIEAKYFSESLMP